MFANVTDALGEFLRVHRATQGAGRCSYIVVVCIKENESLVFLFGCSRGDGPILVLNMLLQTWLLLLFCEAVLINGAVPPCSSVSGRSPPPDSVPCVSPVAEQSCF